MEPCGGDGKVWEYLLQKAILGQQRLLKGVRNQEKWSGVEWVILKWMLSGQQVHPSLGCR